MQSMLLSLLTFSAIVTGLHVDYSKDFPLGSEVENLALRPSRSSMVIVVYTFPRIYDVPLAASSTLRLVHTFQGTNGVSSIAESSTPDVYFVITGNFSFQILPPRPNFFRFRDYVDFSLALNYREDIPFSLPLSR